MACQSLVWYRQKQPKRNRPEDKNATVVAVSKPAMTTNVGMFEWLLAIIQANPLVLVIVAGAAAAAAYWLVEETVVK